MPSLPHNSRSSAISSLQTVSYNTVSGTPSGNALQLSYPSLGSTLTYTLGTSPSTLWIDDAALSVGDYHVVPASAESRPVSQEPTSPCVKGVAEDCVVDVPPGVKACG